MTIVKYNPWGFGELQNELNRFFGHRGAQRDAVAPKAHWQPRVDIREFDDRYTLELELPGVDPEAVEITLDEGVLSISGERTPAEDAGSLRRNERTSGEFQRRFTLPEGVDTEQVTASHRHGVLTIAVPKQPKSQARRISVAA